MNYKLTITRSKNAKCFYIQTTYRKRDGKLSSKTVKKLGNEKYIKENYGVEDAEAWARAELERMRIAAREQKQGLLVMRPVYVRSEKRIEAHFFTCFIALLVLKIMQRQLHDSFPIGQIRKTLAEMNLVKLEGFGYVPSFNNTPLATAIQENAHIHIDRQINTQAQLRADYRLARKC